MCVWWSILSFHLYEKLKSGWTINRTREIVKSQLKNLCFNSKISVPCKKNECWQQINQEYPSWGLSKLVPYVSRNDLWVLFCTGSHSFIPGGNCLPLVHVIETASANLCKECEQETDLFTGFENKEILYLFDMETTLTDTWQGKYFLAHWTENTLPAEEFLNILNHDSVNHSEY